MAVIPTHSLKKKYKTMALYDKQELVKMAEEAIKRNNLFFVNDIIAWLPCSTSTFYELFPEGSEESEYFKRLLNENKIRMGYVS